MEKAPKARIGDLDKKKYLVPSDLTGKTQSKMQPAFESNPLPSQTINLIIFLDI